MIQTRNLLCAWLLLSCGSFAGELPPSDANPIVSAAPTSGRSEHRFSSSAAKPSNLTGTHPAEVVVSAPRTPPVPVASSSSRTVAYRETDVIPIATRVRFSTLILLPKAERILDFTTGDKDFWAISGSENVAYVKPAKERSQTNLNLVTASGNVYSFLLTETSGQDASPDLKVFVEVAEPKMAEAANGPPRFVAASQIEDYRQQVEIAKEETRNARQAAQISIDRSIESFRSGYPTNLKFEYKIEREKKPFQVVAMYHDDKFTYIRATPQETPVVYELKDGKPNLINFDYRDGTYVMPKILESGYLTVGKEKLPFKREE